MEHKKAIFGNNNKKFISRGNKKSNILVNFEQDTALQVLRGDVAPLVVTQYSRDAEESLARHRGSWDSQDILGNLWKICPEVSRCLLTIKI